MNSIKQGCHFAFFETGNPGIKDFFVVNALQQCFSTLEYPGKLKGCLQFANFTSVSGTILTQNYFISKKGYRKVKSSETLF
jgi:hypothetical protein